MTILNNHDILCLSLLFIINPYESKYETKRDEDFTVLNNNHLNRPDEK